MAKDDVLALKRELERTNLQLRNSLKLNIVLEKANQKLEQLNSDAKAWKSHIAIGVGDVHGLIVKSKTIRKPQQNDALECSDPDLASDVNAEDGEPAEILVPLIRPKNVASKVRIRRLPNTKRGSLLAVSMELKTCKVMPRTAANKQVSRLQCNKCRKVFKF